MKIDKTLWMNAAVFSIFFVLFLHAMEDPDIWFHMTIGRAVLDQGAIPTEEFYIFTRLGQASEFHEWGFGLIYHLLYEMAGSIGAIFFNAMLGALTVFILYLTLRHRGLSIAVSLGAAAVGFWLMEFRFVQRPENFLYLSIAVTIYFTEAYRRHSNWRYLVILPFVGLALSQIHPSVILLVLVMGTYLVETAFRTKPDLTEIYQLGTVIVSTLLLSLLNPYGLDQLILPIKFSLETDFLQSFNEFLPAMSTGYAYRFVIALLLIGFSMTGLHKRFSLAEWLMLISFSYLAYQHVRDIALLGIILVLPLATALDAHLKHTRYQFSMAILVLVLVTIDSTRFHRLSFDIDPTVTPVSGAETVAQYSRSNNILNFYHLGNYLAWRLSDSHKVIIDGRNFRNNNSIKLHDLLLSASPGWENALSRYDIDAIVTPATLPYSGNFIPLAFKLIHNPNWVMLNREPAGVVFIRKDRVLDNKDVLLERELWLQAKDELNKNLSDFPDSASSLNSLEIIDKYLTDR